MAGVKGRSGGHNRLPTRLKARRGTLRKSRLNPKEPRLEVFLPAPPPWLSPRACDFYARLGAIAEIAAVVTRADGDALGLAAAALEELVEADEIIRKEGAVLTRTTENGEVHYRHPAAIQRADAWRRYRDALRAFGLDPQSRAGVSAILASDDPLEKRYLFQ